MQRQTEKRKEEKERKEKKRKKNKKNNIFCINCGKKGHKYKYCRSPIISAGIILYREIELIIMVVLKRNFYMSVEKIVSVMQIL